MRKRSHWGPLCVVAFSFLCGSLSADLLAGSPSPRFTWQVHRLGNDAPAGSRARVTSEPVLLKFDTATGRIWRYAGEFQDVSGSLLKVGEEGFSTIDVEELDTAPGKSPLSPGRFELMRIGVPTVIKDDTGTRTVDKRELMLVDSLTGRTWILRRIRADVDGEPVQTYRFLLLTSEGETPVEEVAASEPATEPTEDADARQRKKAAKQAKQRIIIPPDAFAPVSPFGKYTKSEEWWRNAFLDNAEGNTFRHSNFANVDCVVLVSKDPGGSLPMLLFRERVARLSPLPHAAPQQKRLISDGAVDYICRAINVPVADATRLAIYIGSSGKVRGFAYIDDLTFRGLPDIEHASGVMRIE